MTADLAARVARGMAVLDERMPGWVGHVDLDRLEMATGMHRPRYGICGCLLSQLDMALSSGELGTYHNGLFRLGWRVSRESARWATRHAFYLPATAGSEAYDDLTQAWRDAVTARRQGAPA